MTLVKTQNVCLNCEKPFESGKKTAKYCSSKCRGRCVKACEICGLDFNARRRDNITTCSDKCRATRNKWPVKGSMKACEACGKQFEVKNVRFSRTCNRKCAAALRIKEGTNSMLCVPSTWQIRLKRCIAKLNAKWQNNLVRCEQCGRHRTTSKGRCKQCIERLSTRALATIQRSVQEWLMRYDKKCRVCDNKAGFYKHYCKPCLRKKKRDTHDHNHRQRCRRHGSEYHSGVTLQVIIARDGMECHYCKRETVRWNGHYDPQMTTLDHVIPISLGGGHTMQNAVIACSECNTRKSNKQTCIC